ncbi:MAG: methyltransferase domain-containing protein [SAR324 cluster bacterium]|nr:methyltransferase domain-containing protein [SAR324 cluster bacterium]
MALDTYYKDHWLEIEPERLDRYEKQFQWSKANERLLEPARVEQGQMVADFGCGPGAIAIELARQVGPQGHVHALDINADFVARAREKADRAGISERITVHHLTGERLPFEPGALDLLVAKSVLVYVDDAAATFQEFRRVVKPGGRVYAINADWGATIVEPVPLDQWRTFLDAASHAFRNPLIGRQMYGIARNSGFSSVELQVVTIPDTGGRYVNHVHNMAGYAREAGRISEKEIQAVLDIVDRAIKEGTFLAVNPQFIVTAVV